MKIAKNPQFSPGYMLAILFVIAVLPISTLAQATFTAQVRGLIQDDTGAAVPRATVTITNNATQVAERAVTDEAGRYIFNSLPPAAYTCKVEAAGFKTLLRSNLVLRVSQQIDLDFTLEVGNVNETVSVTTEATLLNTVSAALGTEITNRYILNMPLLDRDPANLVFLAAGVTEVQGAGVNAIRGTNFVSNGQRNATAEIRLDGALASVPESGEGGTTTADYQPSVEIIQEFKLQNNSFSSEYGNNGGTVINVITKSGGNEFHGSGWWFGRRPAFDANNFFANRAGESKADYARDLYGGSIGGPLWLPKAVFGPLAYAGRNRTFFFFDYQKTRDNSPYTLTTTVPTALEKRGDFSKSFNDDGTPVRVFNPFAVSRNTAGDYIRQPLPGNVVPTTLLDPVAVKLMSLFPDPTGAGDPGTGRQNFTRNLVSANPSYQYDIKLDHVLTDKQRLSGRYSFARRESLTPSVFLDGVVSATSSRNVVIEHNWTPSASMLWTNRVGVLRNYGKTDVPGVDLTSVGFPAYLKTSPEITKFPHVNVDGYQGLVGACCPTIQGQTQFMVSSSFSKVSGGHNLKFGGEKRIFLNNFWQSDAPTGGFDFARATTAQNVFAPDDAQGNGLASLLLGFMSGGGIGLNGHSATKSTETAFYVQDDWKVNQRLTLNLGLRYEWSTPYTERFNRLQWSDFNADSGIDVPGVGRIRGISRFASKDQRTIGGDWNNLGPRLGFAYRLNQQTVVRGGAGLYFGLNPNTNFQYLPSAYELGQGVIASKDGGITRFATLSNPFPNGITPPPGPIYGPQTRWGFGNSANLSDEFRNAEIYQWNIGIQRELPGSILFEVNYSGNRSTHLPFGSRTARNRNIISRAAREQWGTAGLAQLVPNPFQYLFVQLPGRPAPLFNEPASVYNDAMIPRRNLLRPYPQHSSAFAGNPPFAANASYHALQVRFEKRYSHGLNFTGNYTFSRFTDDISSGYNSWLGNLEFATSTQDLTNLRAERAISASDAPHRLAFALSYDLPVGRGRMLGREMPRVLDAVVGGWKVNTLVTVQSGNPLAIVMNRNRLQDGRQRPNLSGDPRSSFSIKDVVDRKGIYFNAAAFSDPGDQRVGNAPRQLSNVRGPGIRNIDLGLFKEFRFREKMLLQLRAEFINFTNTPRFGTPGTRFGSGSFGQINSQSNGPRQGQVGVRFEF